MAAGLLVARLYQYGPQPAARIATTLLARGEFALILAAMATSAGLDGRLAPFIAGYVLVLAVLGPVVAGRAHLLAHVLRAAAACLPGHRARTSFAVAPSAEPVQGPSGTCSDGDAGPPTPSGVPTEAQR